MRIFIYLLLFYSAVFAKPMWLDDPSMGGRFVGAIGYSENIENKLLQQRRAILKAKASLSQIQHIEINDKTEISIDEFGEVDSNFETQSKSDAILKTEVKDRFIDKDGSLYIWLIQI